MFFLTLFLSYNVILFLFIHTHNVNGSIVVHSHISTTGEHSHSSPEYTAISYFNHFNVEKANVWFTNSINLLDFIVVECIAKTSLIQNTPFNAYFHRGPPLV